MMFHLQINKFLCVILYFFDVFISSRKCQDTLQLNTCTKDERNSMSKMYCCMVCVGYSNNTLDLFHYFQLNLSNVEDVEDYKTNDKKLHCIVLSLFHFMLKTLEMCTMCTNYNVDSNTK